LIGLFDSGLGGLSVWREVRRCIPDAPLIYLADQAHVPYGPRSAHEIKRFTEACVRWLIDQGCTVIVIACNTATAAALPYLRETFPQIKFVGMEPAVKPAVALTKTGVIGVLATHTTVKSERFAQLVQRFASANHIRVIEQACPAWVDLVERGEFDQPVALAQVNHDLWPLLCDDADTIVLGCTHFPFLANAIQQTLAAWCERFPSPKTLHLIDPAPAVAQQCLRLWQAQSPIQSSNVAINRFYTTGNASAFAQLASHLLGVPIALNDSLTITQ